MSDTFFQKVAKMFDHIPNNNWRCIRTIDAHTAGEPLRIIVAGYPSLKGDSILAMRRYIKERYDHLRTALMWEPRGHADMYGCIITPPTTAEADFGVIFLHNEGYSSMCGHGIIAVTKVVLETGLFPMTSPVTCLKIDAPAGLITAYARITHQKVEQVYFHNVPSFVVELDVTVKVPGLGRVTYDLAYGGAFYAYVKAESVGLDCTPAHYRQLIDVGMQIKRAIISSRKITHPYEDDLSFLYGTIFTAPPHDPQSHSRNVCIFAEGEVDRSPTGTGVSGRVAIHFARGEIDLNEPIVIESIIDSKFTVSAVKTTSFGDYPSVIPQVEGNAHILGKNEWWIDPEDPLQNGFILR
jgi:trans-L-3-hydroxyproline dehydratase